MGSYLRTHLKAIWSAFASGVIAFLSSLLTALRVTNREPVSRDTDDDGTLAPVMPRSRRRRVRTALG